MIYLNAEVVSGLGKNTFCSWFKREFPSSSFETPQKLENQDILLRYSTLGFLPISGKQVALCWELYPEMKRIFSSSQWDDKISRVYQTARYSTYRTVATKYSIRDYEMFGSVNVIPIGVDTELFKPLDAKESLRIKYGIPIDKEVGIWIGTLHPMKGFIELMKYSSSNPGIHWIIIWKWQVEAGKLEGANNFVKVSQNTICELINAADFSLFTSMLAPFYMAEWEAMSCNIPIVLVGGAKREFEISKNPREDLFKYGWDRKSVKTKWEIFFKEKGILW
jgi:glycosyltransferase involved in cell wall biosynthesis